MIVTPIIARTVSDGAPRRDFHTNDFPSPTVAGGTSDIEIVRTVVGGSTVTRRNSPMESRGEFHYERLSI